MIGFKKINLVVASSTFPYQLTISNCCNSFIARKTIFSNNSKFCLCSLENCFKLSAKYNNQTITKKVVLSRNKCQTIIVNFNFSAIISNSGQIQNFSLLDKTYGLPVKIANLNFR